MFHVPAHKSGTAGQVQVTTLRTTSIANLDQIMQLQNRVKVLQARRSCLIHRFGVDDSDVINLNREIARLQSTIDSFFA